MEESLQTFWSITCLPESIVCEVISLQCVHYIITKSLCQHDVVLTTTTVNVCSMLYVLQDKLCVIGLQGKIKSSKKDRKGIDQMIHV